MKYFPANNVALLRYWPMRTEGGIAAKQPSRTSPAYVLKQRGVVLFITLIALLAMSLAAVALIRSVDTSAMIAGNLAFSQAATITGTAEIESAITVVTNLEVGSGGADVKTDPAHLLNNNDPANGYYASVDPNVDLTNSLQFDWTLQASAEVNDGYGNRKRFVIHRLCRNATPIDPILNDCLFAPVQAEDKNSQAVVGSDEVCVSGVAGGCSSSSSETVQYRITVQTQGPKNTVGYVQAFVY